MAFASGDSYTFSDDGFSIGDAFGNPLFHKIGGASSPVGVIAPTIATRYYQTNGDIWFHTGTGGNTAWTPVEGQYVWSRLGSFKFASAANASSIITIPPRDLLRIRCSITGYSANGIASLRFGGVSGAVDSGNTYNTLHATGVQGSSKWDLYANTVTTNFFRLAVSNAVLGRMVSVELQNFATTRKLGTITTITDSGAVGTNLQIATGLGLWANTTQQIVSVQMIATANNMNIGSGFVVEGINIL
jgi:hypothetical protein